MKTLNVNGSPWLFWRARRYMVTIMAFFGFFNIYALRVNLSIAIVDMTQLKNITLENGTVVEMKEFDWDNRIQGIVLSSFFYGYITTQLAGGYLALKFGGKVIFGTGIAITALLTFITPWLVNVHVYLLIALRVVEGVFEGVTYPCIHAIWAKWAHPLERSRLAIVAFSGSYVGTVVSMPLGAYLAKAFGWESIFYFFGAVGIIWYILWMTLVADSPESDPKITEEEKKYILDSLNRTENKTAMKVPWKSILLSPAVWAIVIAQFSENWGFYTMLTQLPKYLKGAVGIIWYILWMTLVADSPESDPKITEEEKKYILDSLNRTENKTAMKVPWKSILLSPAVWAIVIAQFSENWGFYTMLTQLPKYLKDVLQYDLGQSGFLSALPYLAMSILFQFSGHWGDVLQEKKILTTTQVRKIFNCAAFIAQTVFMVTAAFLNNRGGTISCLTIAVGLGAFAWVGFSVNHLDIAPQYASILMGISNAFATLPGMISPVLTGYIVPSHGATATQWQTVFYISAGIYLVGAIVYGLCASGELQSWAVDQENLEGQEMKDARVEKQCYENEIHERDEV